MVILFEVNIKKKRGRSAMGMVLCQLCVICTAISSTSQKPSNHIDNITAWSRVLFAIVIGSQIVKKFPAFYGTRMLITAYVRARHLFLF
jgi:hypothetical protein